MDKILMNLLLLVKILIDTNSFDVGKLFYCFSIENTPTLCSIMTGKKYISLIVLQLKNTRQNILI